MELSSPWHLPTFPFLLKISQGTFIFFLYVHKNEVSLEFPFAHLLSLLLVIFYPTCSLVSSHLIQWSRNTTIRRSLYTITSSGFIIALFCFSKKGPSFPYSLLSLLYVVSLSDRGKALLKRRVLFLQTPFFMNYVINLSSFEHGFMVFLTFSPLNMGNSAKRHTKKSGGIQNLLYAEA